jgi:hypothetical protein
MEKALTGVIDSNDPRVYWLLEDFFYDGIDIDYETALKEVDGNHEKLEEWERGTTLIGFVKGEDGLYDIDEKEEFAAILRETVVQIVKSPVTVKCAMCSPCYPGQGDLSSKGHHLTYAPMPEHEEEI